MTISQQIRALKWVKSFKLIGDDGYQLVTKANALKTQLTYGYIEQASLRGSSYRLEHPIIVPLPSYKITLKQVEEFNDDDELEMETNINVSSVKIPRFPKNAPPYFRAYPTSSYYSVAGMGSEEWSEFFTEKYYLCLGDYEVLLTNAQDWLESVKILGEYLQVAIPDSGGVKNRTQWAYGIGLVGKEVIQEIKPQ